MSYRTEFIDKYISNIPCNFNHPTYKKYRKKIHHFEDQAVYIYSFKEKRMVYTSGWESLLGYKDEEVNLSDLISITTPRYVEYSKKFYDKAIDFIHQKSDDLEKYSISVQSEKIHENGNHIPLFIRIGIYKANNGEVEEIIGVFDLIKTLKYGEVFKYETYGPEIYELDEELNTVIKNPICVTEKEKEALTLASKGLTFKEIANNLSVSQSAIEKRILPLYKRFNVKSLPHLIDFAHNNHLL